MTSAQRSLFFGWLWPAACQAQGWLTHAEREARRRAIVQRVTEARAIP